MSQLPFLPSRASVPHLGSYGVMLLPFSLSRRVAEQLPPAGQFSSCCWPCKTRHYSGVCRRGNRNSEWRGNSPDGVERNTENGLQLADSKALSSSHCAYHETRMGYRNSREENANPEGSSRAARFSLRWHARTRFEK